MEHPAYTLSGLSLVGGIVGYAKKGSIPSIVAGTAFSIIYGYAGYLLKNNADNGLEIALGASSLLFLAGLGRSIPTKFSKPLPLGLTILGVTSTAYYYKKYKEFYP